MQAVLTWKQSLAHGTQSGAEETRFSDDGSNFRSLVGPPLLSERSQVQIIELTSAQNPVTLWIGDGTTRVLARLSEAAVSTLEDEMGTLDSEMTGDVFVVREATVESTPYGPRHSHVRLWIHRIQYLYHKRKTIGLPKPVGQREKIAQLIKATADLRMILVEMEVELDHPLEPQSQLESLDSERPQDGEANTEPRLSPMGVATQLRTSQYIGAPTPAAGGRKVNAGINMSQPIQLHQNRPATDFRKPGSVGKATKVLLDLLDASKTGARTRQQDGGVPPVVEALNPAPRLDLTGSDVILNAGATPTRSPGDQNSARSAGDQNSVRARSEQESTQPPGGQNSPRPPGDQASIQAPSEQISTRLPGVQNSIRPPGDQNPARSAGGRNSVRAPSGQESTQPPGDQKSIQAPSEQISTRPPDEQNSIQAPSEQNSILPPDDQNSLQPPGDQNPARSAGERNSLRAPSEQESTQPPGDRDSHSERVENAIPAEKATVPGKKIPHKIPREQRVILDSPFSWLPSLSGRSFPCPNVPRRLLETWNAAVDEAQSRTSPAGLNDAGEEAANGAHAGGDNGFGDETMDSPVESSDIGSLSWSDSQPSRSPRHRLPPDSSVSSPRPSQTNRHRNRGASSEAPPPTTTSTFHSQSGPNAVAHAPLESRPPEPSPDGDTAKNISPSVPQPSGGNGSKFGGDVRSRASAADERSSDRIEEQSQQHQSTPRGPRAHVRQVSTSSKGEGAMGPPSKHSSTSPGKHSTSARFRHRASPATPSDGAKGLFMSPPKLGWLPKDSTRSRGNGHGSGSSQARSCATPRKPDRMPQDSIRSRGNSHGSGSSQARGRTSPTRSAPVSSWEPPHDADAATSVIKCTPSDPQGGSNTSHPHPGGSPVRVPRPTSPDPRETHQRLRLEHFKNALLPQGKSDR